MVYTNSQILKWRENKAIEPKTGNIINVRSKQYKILFKESSKLFDKEYDNLTLFRNDVNLYPISSKIKEYENINDIKEFFHEILFISRTLNVEIINGGDRLKYNRTLLKLNKCIELEKPNKLFEIIKFYKRWVVGTKIIIKPNSDALLLTEYLTYYYLKVPIITCILRRNISKYFYFGRLRTCFGCSISPGVVNTRIPFPDFYLDGILFDEFLNKNLIVLNFSEANEDDQIIYANIQVLQKCYSILSFLTYLDKILNVELNFPNIGFETLDINENEVRIGYGDSDDLPSLNLNPYLNINIDKEISKLCEFNLKLYVKDKTEFVIDLINLVENVHHYPQWSKDNIIKRHLWNYGLKLTPDKLRFYGINKYCYSILNKIQYLKLLKNIKNCEHYYYVENRPNTS
jgi:hypothetical protein